MKYIHVYIYLLTVYKVITSKIESLIDALKGIFFSLSLFTSFTYGKSFFTLSFTIN